MGRAWLIAVALLSLGCPEDPTAPRPMGELKPVSGPPPVPPPQKQTQTPDEAPPAQVDEPKFAAEAAPVKFTLGRHHHPSLDQIPWLPRDLRSFEVSHWPVIKYSTGEDLAKGRAPALFDWSVLLVAQDADGLSIRHAGKKETWAGGRGWLLLLLDAPRTAGIEKLPMAFPGRNTTSKKGTTVEVNTFGVDGTSSFRVRSLAAAKTWKLTVTSKAKDGEVVAPIVALLTDLAPGVKAATIDGKPVVRHTAVLKPGSYTLSGATALWVTVPSVDALKIGDLEVELSAL